jgi:allophanate hydrolase
MCGVVGLKPTVGRFSSRGIVPAVKRIDCPTVFARSVSDARRVAQILGVHDALDPFSRVAAPTTRTIRTVGVPLDRSWLADVMDLDALRAYESVIEQAAGFWTIVPIDIAPFLDAGRLLYGGPLVAERTAAVGAFLATNPEGADPTVAGIIGGGTNFSALDAYENEYRLAELRLSSVATWKTVDALLLPTIPGVTTLADVALDPVGANMRMGTFTTFMNLLDLAGLAVPVGRRADGLPFGVQLVGQAWNDEALADAAQVLLGEPREDCVVRGGEQLLVVVGAHLSLMVLNRQLTSRGARCISAGFTSAAYRLFALAGTVPPKPGLLRVEEGGREIAVEVWALSKQDFGSFVGEIPHPLGIGTVELADGSWCKGFICEPVGLLGATDITEFGGWRAYCADLQGGN